jgi:ferredoxin-type protein NapG
MFIPTVHADRCTGCGMCEKSCVLPEAAIKVLPMRLARATSADHYRRGWEEKEAKGGQVVEGIIDLPDRLPGPGTDNLAAPGGFEPAFRLPGATQ